MKNKIEIEWNGKRYRLVNLRNKVACGGCAFENNNLISNCPRNERGIMPCFASYNTIWKEMKK